MNKNSKNQLSGKYKSSVINVLLRYPCLVITVFALGVYFQTLFFDIIYLDDNYILSVDVKGWVLTGINDAVTSSYMNGSYYRPLVNLIFFANYQIGGDSPLIYHLTNLFLHSVCSCLIYLLLRKMKYKREASLTMGVIFAAHPLFVNAVAWIPGCNDMLAACFCLLSVIFFIDYIEKNKILYLILHCFALILAVFSKELAILTPVVLVAYRGLRVRDKSFAMKKLFVLCIWLTISVLPVIMKRFFDIPMTDPYFSLSNIILNIRAIPETIAKYIFPINIDVLPTFSFFPTVLGCIALIVAVAYIIRKKASLNLCGIAFGVLWFLIYFLPGMFIRIKDIGNDYLDCRAYLPVAGLLIVLMELFPYKIWNWRRKLYFLATVFIVVLLSSLTVVQSVNYKDKVHFWEKVVNDNPRKTIFIKRLAEIYNKDGKYEDAIKALEKAIYIKKFDSAAGDNIPADYRLYMDMSDAYSKKGDIHKALELLDKSIGLKPDYVPAYIDRGSGKAQLGYLEAAEADFSRAIELDPNSSEAYNNRGLARMNLGIQKKALSDFDKAIEVNPRYFEAYNNRGYLKTISGDYKAAVEDYGKALEINTEHSFAYNNRGYAKLKMKDLLGAMEDINKSLKIMGDNSYAYKNRALVYIELGRRAEACKDLRKASYLGFNEFYGNEVDELLKRFCR